MRNVREEKEMFLFNLCFESNWERKIMYKEFEGELYFAYQKEVSIPTKHHSGSWQVYEVSGKVPKDIVAKGSGAIKKYAEQRVKNGLKKQKENNAKWEEFEKNPNFPISVEFDGKTLEGKIISCEDTELKVRLESPKEYQGEDFIIYGMASAMSGHKRFKKLGEFTDDALETARNLLVGIYKNKKHELENKEVIELVKKLN